MFVGDCRRRGNSPCNCSGALGEEQQFEPPEVSPDGKVDQGGVSAGQQGPLQCLQHLMPGHIAGKLLREDEELAAMCTSVLLLWCAIGLISFPNELT